MLGYLLARAGVEVVVLEKHADFFRDFRGDTVHPSTLQVMHELGMLEEFLELPHQRLTSVTARVGDFDFHAAEFSRLPTRCKFVALMPQWDFLNFLSARAQRFPQFQLRKQCEAVSLLRDGETTVGVEAHRPTGRCKYTRTWWSGAMGGTLRYGERRVWKCKNLACRSMCCGFVFRGERAIPSNWPGISTTEKR